MGDAGAMKLHSAWPVCAALLWCAGPTRAQPALELTLEVGEQRVVSAEHIASYSEGVSGVVDVRLTRDGASFVIVGQAPGRTSLLFMLDDGAQRQYRIVVTAAEREAQNGSNSSAPPQVPVRDNIRLDFYFVQLSRDGQQRLGLSWPATFGGGTAAAAFDLRHGMLTDATAVITDQALPRLDLAQAKGWAKLMRQATLITANGSGADVSGGGELNIPVQTSLSVGLRQITFGSTVKINPRYDRDSGRIELEIHAEVSDLTSDHGSGVPGRVLAAIDSVVNLELGQSVVLAGLTARSEASSTTGVPGLSQLPILGPLFGTSSRRSEHSENIIVIVPSVVESVALDARERIRAALSLYANFAGDFDKRPLGSTRGHP
jgi:pilus assembly protein CpaC